MFMNYRAKEKRIKKHIIKNTLKFLEQTKTLSKKKEPTSIPETLIIHTKHHTSEQSPDLDFVTLLVNIATMMS